MKEDFVLLNTIYTMNHKENLFAAFPAISKKEWLEKDFENQFLIDSYANVLDVICKKDVEKAKLLHNTIKEKLLQ